MFFSSWNRMILCVILNIHLGLVLSEQVTAIRNDTEVNVNKCLHFLFKIRSGH